MPNYRRSQIPGGCYFFTVNLLERYPNDRLVRHIDLLRTAVTNIRQKYPFQIDGWVVLPDHIHCIWTLPPGDEDYPTRWRLIKTMFAKQLPATERHSKVRHAKGERGIWQRRYWEHQIRDDRDYAAHMDYLHYNPVKHSLVRRVTDWPYSTFHRLVRAGVYSPEWAGGNVEEITAGEWN